MCIVDDIVLVLYSSSSVLYSKVIINTTYYEIVSSQFVTGSRRGMKVPFQFATGS